MKIVKYDRETLLYILFSYKRMIQANKDFPTVLINDLEKSIDYVLKKNDYKYEGDPKQ